jgi:2-succinyl-6-hydroxy-2,4-cyclohexadiene-1-carboxylate synthase
MSAPVDRGVETRRIVLDDISYHVTVAGAGPPLLLLHGFTGNAATWAPFMPALSRRFRAIAVDLPGHGDTEAPQDARCFSMARAGADLPALCASVTGGHAPFVVLGYSMGGRVALHLALAAPEHVAALALESASPGIADPEARAARVAADRALAERIEREGIASFVAHWEALPLFASQRRLPREVVERQRAQRLSNRPAGLASSLRGMGAGAQEPLHGRLAELRMPALLLAGALDEQYRALAQSMAPCMPRARVEIVPDAGHAVHLEQPAAFARALLAFLAETHP